jgi:hypothetical protein
MVARETRERIYMYSPASLSCASIWKAGIGQRWAALGAKFERVQSAQRRAAPGFCSSGRCAMPLPQRDTAAARGGDGFLRAAGGRGQRGLRSRPVRPTAARFVGPRAGARVMGHFLSSAPARRAGVDVLPGVADEYSRGTDRQLSLFAEMMANRWRTRRTIRAGRRPRRCGVTG